VVPLSTFAAARTLDIVQEMERAHVMPVPPGRMGHPNEFRPNLDGLLTFTNPGAGQPPGGYAQVLRSGAVEGVDVLHIDDETGGPYLLGATFESTAATAIRNYVTFVKSLGLGYPIVIFVSFCGMLGCRLRTPTEIGVGHYTAGPLTQDVIPLPEISLESETQDPADLLRPIFNQVWNAFGFMGSSKFDRNGKWIGRV
jgi:hypothetical protein